MPRSRIAARACSSTAAKDGVTTMEAVDADGGFGLSCDIPTAPGYASRFRGT
jgi:hypothetical protein